MPGRNREALSQCWRTTESWGTLFLVYSLCRTALRRLIRVQTRWKLDKDFVYLYPNTQYYCVRTKNTMDCFDIHIHDKWGSGAGRSIKRPVHL